MKSSEISCVVTEVRFPYPKGECAITIALTGSVVPKFGEYSDTASKRVD